MHLTPRQLAARWHVSEKTLERWRHTDTGPGFLKIVGRILYPLADVEAIEAKHSHFVTTPPLPVGSDLDDVVQPLAGSRGRV